LSSGQLATLGLTFVAVVGLVVGSAYWVNVPTWAVLFSDMDAESAGGVVTRLKNDKVPYLLDEGGRTIRVPAARVDELRLGFAGQGMPTSGRVGFEIFDRTAFGVTDFLEHVNYRRALEGELARTISTITEVSNARVHIAMPRPSLFAGQDLAAKASVVLKLRNNRPLSASTITAISGLVAASVEALRPESVVIMDTFGRPLTRGQESGDEAAGGLQVERQQRLEHELSSRVVAMLEPIVGSAGVRVNISAKINPDSQEETEERWDPTPVMRSRQSVTQNGALAAGAQGVAGARANMPEPPAPAKADPSGKPAAATAATASPAPPGGAASPALAAALPAAHSSETTNYELSRLTRHRIQPRGQIARLSVAVLLDDDHSVKTDAAGATTRATRARTPGEIQKIHDVVAAAVGFDADRGDQLTVENISFEEPVVDDHPASAEPWWRRFGPQLLDGGRVVSVLLVALLVVFAVIRPVMKQTLRTQTMVLAGAAPGVLTASVAVAEPGAAPTASPRSIADMELDLDAEILEGGSALTAQQRRLPALTRRLTKNTVQEPENAARLIRSWLNEDGR
jgi:flagellar M-ring protein FliF